MKTQKINEQSILIELDSMPENAQETVKTAFLESGITPEGEIEVISFAGNGGVLMFATKKPSGCVLYRFDSLENIIGGAQAICDACASPTTFFYHNGKYFLLLQEEHPCLLEFGNKEENPAFTSAYLMEYGKILCRDDAVQMLSRVFHT